ncbi:MAG: hypothetical protein ACK4YM_00500 [Novosphingobium sp.]
MNRKLLLAILGAMLAAGTAMPNVANATGYVRIGDKCYIDIGAPGSNAPAPNVGYPVLVQVACPDEVSENS